MATTNSANATGTASGAFVATFLVGYLVKMGYLAAIATATAQPESAVVLGATIIITSVANYVVTHTALKRVEDLIPTVDATYPNDAKPPSNVSNINKG
jgi:hypothetical protein